MGSLSFDRRWVCLGLLLSAGLGLPASSQADPLVVSELSSCHCVLDAPFSPRTDPARPRLTALYEPKQLLLLRLSQRHLVLTELTVLRVLNLEPLSPPKSKVAGGMPVKRVRASRDPGIRGSFRVGEGKELSVALTPTPKHCAPLVEMRF